MGIDIYAKWLNQTKVEEDKQYCGFNAWNGYSGYLREAYHGEPYATHFFVKEAFESQEAQARIPAKVLKERLPETIKLVREREQGVYQETDEYSIWKTQKSFVDFYKLCKRKEKENGEACIISASY